MLEIADKVIDGIKAIRDIAKRIENAELQSRIADLMGSSADLKMEIAELKSGILELREENANLRKRADLRAKMRVDERVLYPTEEIPGYGSGPFCPICFEKAEHLITVQNTPTRVGGAVLTARTSSDMRGVLRRRCFLPSTPDPPASPSVLTRARPSCRRTARSA